jgi:hypothetical protein
MSRVTKPCVLLCDDGGLVNSPLNYLCYAYEVSGSARLSDLGEITDIYAYLVA